MCFVVVILLATRVHVDPGLVPAHAGDRTRAAAPVRARAAARTQRALVGAPAPVPAHDHAPGIEVMSEYTYILIFF